MSSHAPNSYPDSYPEFPGSKEPDTSRQAAVRIASRAETLRRAVLGLFQGGFLLTADECAERLGVNILSIRPRVSELVAQGLVAETTMRRLNASGMSAKVWRLAKPQLELFA